MQHRRVVRLGIQRNFVRRQGLQTQDSRATSQAFGHRVHQRKLLRSGEKEAPHGVPVRIHARLEMAKKPGRILHLIDQ